MPSNAAEKARSRDSQQAEANATVTSDPERLMLIFAQLASIASRKQQMIGRDRFLILTGAYAARSGLPEVAQRCQQLIAARAPRHLITRYASFADALRDDEFAPFLRQIERFCPPERAEHLLSGMGIDLPDTRNDQSAADLAVILLSQL